MRINSYSINRLLALVTHIDMPALTDDDHVLLTALAERGMATVVVSWDDPTVDWSRFGLLILRSCWNSHLKPVQFERWLEELEARRIRILNPLPLLKWNFSKTYLFDLAARGIAIPPTVFVDDSSGTTLIDILTRQHWEEAVVKPAISASAHRTSRVSVLTAPFHEGAFVNLLRRGRMLVQQFIPEVVERGELSFVFLAGHYSHTVRKTVAPGDFRVQTEFGGDREPAAPNEALIEQARRILAVACRHAAYARIDAVEVKGKLVLMELELIDPVLFFAFCPQSEALLVRSIERAMKCAPCGRIY